MRTWFLGPGAGQPISAFGSQGVMLAPVLRSEGLHVVAMDFRPGGFVARHPAADVQILLVVDGSGMVTGGIPSFSVPVEAGSVVLWDRGEDHETRAGPAGLRVLVLEGPALRGYKDTFPTPGRGGAAGDGED